MIKANDEDSITFVDFSLVTANILSEYQRPVLQNYLRKKGSYLSIWPKFDHKLKRFEGETWHCVLDGQAKIRMASPVFQQNLY